MDKTVIFLNGDKSDLSLIGRYIDKNTLIIGCDGGAEQAIALGYKPDIIIGDLDSINEKNIPQGAEIIRHPGDKDYTDSEAALKHAIAKGAKEIILTGFSGDRVDHMLGNIFLLPKPEFAGPKIRIVEGKQEIYMITGTAEIMGKAGETISFIPLFGDVRAIFSSGLKYDLSRNDLSMQGNTGISNELVKDKARIDVGESRLLAVHTRS